MIDTNGYGSFRTYDVHCDSCIAYENFDTAGDFIQAIKDAKDSGWKIVKDGAVWKHFCFDCSERKLEIENA